jgi:serine/threonine protein kinase
MHSTTRHDIHATQTVGGGDAKHDPPVELMGHYKKIVTNKRLNWTTHHRLQRLLGSGGQGVVFLSERRGIDGFTLPVAMKVFSPERFEDAKAYSEAMSRIAQVAVHVAQIQHDNLLDVQNFVDRNRIRIMVMEWIDGFDMQRLLVPEMLDAVQHRVSVKRWEYLNRVIVTAGPRQPRIKPGVAVAIVRDCLSALAALHREEIIHGDIKPSNIMLKRTGNAKIIDIGSAFELNNPPPQRTCTPTYAAPEVLEGGASSPRSDLASLGYVLIEMLSGQPCFEERYTYRNLLEAKRMLPQRLDEILPEEVTCNELLMSFCRGLIAPDPMRRFPSAEEADMTKKGGASAFHRQLVLGDMASEYGNEIRLWVEELKEIEDLNDRDD